MAGAERKEGNSVIAFKRRLMQGALTPADRQRLTLAKAIREARAQGMSMRALARTLGLTENSVLGFAARGICTAALHWLAEKEHTPGDKARAEREAAERDEIESLGPHAITFLRDAFRREEKRHPETGEPVSEWVDPGLAMWATGEIIKTRGWNQPRGAGARVVNINIQMKDRVLGSILDDEEKTAEGRARASLTPEALDAEYTELGEDA